MADLILVPRISTLPLHEAHAHAALRWLVKRKLVESLPTTCGALGNRMAYAPTQGAAKIALKPHLLPFEQPVNGLQIITKRCIYTPTSGFLEEAGCPECRQEIGEALFDSLEQWMPGETDNFTCPECGHEDDINGFLFLQPCAFSNLALVFCGWGEAGLSAEFVAQMQEVIGYPLAQVLVER